MSPALTKALGLGISILFAWEANARCGGSVGRDLPGGSIGQSGLSARELVAINSEIDRGEFDVRALLVVRRCTIAFERYGRDLRRDNVHALYSVTKSVSATIAGILVRSGSLSALDVHLSAIISKPSNTSAADWAKARPITVRHVMGMTSGFDTQHSPTDDSLYLTSTDRVFEALKSPLAAPPGTRYRYSDRDAALFGAALEGAGKTGLLGIARERLFAPLDFGRNEWLYPDRQGRYPGGWGLRLRPMDLAKLGQLYLQNGIWNGRAVISPDHIATVWTSGPSAQYGLGWWIGTGPRREALPLRYANGLKGQRVFILPKHDLVVVMIASLTGPEEQAVARIVVEGITRALTSNGATDPPSEQALQELARRGFRGRTRVHQGEQDTPG